MLAIANSRCLCAPGKHRGAFACETINVAKSQRDDLAEIEKLIAKMEPRIARDVLKALQAQQDQVPLEAIIDALRSGDIQSVLKFLDIDATTAAFAVADDDLRDAVWAGGALATAVINQRVTGVAFRFGQLNPRLVTWLQTYSLGLIREINETTREGIRAQLVDGMIRGANPISVAADIKAGIGLTKRQAQAVANFRKELEGFHRKRTAEGYNLGGSIDRVNGRQVFRPDADGLPLDGILNRRLRDFRFDGQLQAAMASGKPLSPEKIDKMVAAYRRKYLKYRAEMIARTEAARTVNMGTQDAWRQAIERGAAPEQLVRRQWIVTKDERTCPECGPVPGLNPKRGVRMGDPFRTPSGPVFLPPLHPSCRCVVFIRRFEPEQLEGVQ